MHDDAIQHERIRIRTQWDVKLILTQWGVNLILTQ